ncbi:MAG TPA: hypothetical protein PK720_00640 [bacterium]|nr:hypothetical protein [bacterium]
MADQNLINYIKEAQGQGITQEQIKDDLLKAGWQAAMVEDGFRALGSPLITPLETTAVLEKKKFSPKLIRGLIIFGSTIAVLIIAFFVFKNKIFSLANPESSEEVSKVDQKKVVSSPFLQFDTELKLADYKKDFAYYEVIWNKEKTCFGIVIEENFNLKEETQYQYISFKDSVVGPVKIMNSAWQEFKFSDDCSTLVFKAQDKEDGLYHIYKNGVAIYTQDQFGIGEYIFDSKSKKIFYMEENSLFIDGVNVGTYNNALPLSSLVKNLKFDNFGNYVFKVVEKNPEYEIFIQKNKKPPSSEFGSLLHGIEVDPNLTLEEKNKKMKEVMDTMTPEEIEKFTDEMLSEESLIQEIQLGEDFKKFNWLTREILVVNGKQTEPFKIIHSFHFTENGDLRYLASKNDGDYFFHDGKLEQLEKYDPTDSFRRSYNNFKSSPDGKKYSYTVSMYKTPSDNFTKNLGNEAIVNQEIEESEKLKKYKLVLNGMVTEEYVGYPTENLIFSADSKHVAYHVSDSANNNLVFLDGKKIGSFPNISSGYYNSLFAFSADNKLYFNTSDTKESCLYINGEKSNCQQGTFDNFTFRGNSFAYVHKYGDHENAARYNVIFNGVVHGPYDSIDELEISPDGTKFFHITIDRKGLFLNGEILEAESAFAGDLEQLAFFTPDSQHIVYSARPTDTKIEIKMDKKVIEEIATPRSYNQGYNQDIDYLNHPGYLFAAPDKKSVWYFFNQRETKQLIVKNIKLGL